MAAANHSDELVNLLADAAVEMTQLEGPSQVVRRLRTMHQQLQPHSTAIDELAQRFDVAPRDMLDAVLATGVREFWHQGHVLRSPAQLHAYLASEFLIDPVPDLEFELSVPQAVRLAEAMGVDVEELLGESEGSPTYETPQRKFAASETAPPESLAGRQQQQEKSNLRKTLAMSALSAGSDLQQLLMDAAVEIAVLDGTQNHVFRRLMAELQNQAGPGSTRSMEKPPRKFSPSEAASPTRAAQDKRHSG